MFVSPPTLNPQNPVKLYLNSLLGERIFKMVDLETALQRLIVVFVWVDFTKRVVGGNEDSLGSELNASPLCLCCEGVVIGPDLEVVT